jgi:hypothetical protein
MPNPVPHVDARVAGLSEFAARAIRSAAILFAFAATVIEFVADPIEGATKLISTATN